jgi:uncharacterized protein involved in response to NO
MTLPPGDPPPLRIAPVTAPTLSSVRPLPPAEDPALEPYRVLFPLGAACGIAGALAWAAQALGWTPWPAMVHASLMVEGFELAFVTGFLLSMLPAFTHGAKCRAWELAAAAAGVTAFAVTRLAGHEPVAHALFAATLAFVALALARRVRPGAAAPPEEFALVGAGLLMGIAGGVVQALASAGVLAEPSPRFGLRLVSRGMMLALVLGLGGLLVPAFAMIREPLRIVGVAPAGQRRGRREFIVALALCIAGALAAEAFGHPRLAAWTRFVAGAASTLLAWKLWRVPPRAQLLPWALWSAGASVLLGLAAAALLPAHEIAAWHAVFIGGYGLLTMAIGTRVVVSHGGHDVRDEGRVLGAAPLAALALALLVRSAAGEADPALAPRLAAAGVLWAIAWALWLAGALPRVLRPGRTRPAPPAPRRGA